jgi:hypothetical protein
MMMLIISMRIITIIAIIITGACVPSLPRLVSSRRVSRASWPSYQQHHAHHHLTLPARSRRVCVCAVCCVTRCSSLFRVRACVRVCGCRWMTRLQGRSSILHHIHAMLLQHSYKKRRGGKHSRANGRGRKKKKTPPTATRIVDIALCVPCVCLCVCVCVCVCVCACALGWPSWRPPARAHLAPHTPAGGGWTLVTLMVRVPRVPGPPLRSARPRRSRSKSGALSGARWVGSASPCVRVGLLGLGGVGRVRGGNTKKRQCRICLCAEAGGH